MIRLFKAGSPAALVFVAGEGGHVEQARRVLAALEPDVRSGCRCILITDSDAVGAGAFDEVRVIRTCAPKHRAAGMGDLLAYLEGCSRVLWHVLRRHDVRMAIVTGPGFALIPALVARLIGARLVVFESWSRFENRSNCSRVLYPFAHKFFVQHEELLKLYPKAVWTGLL